MKKILGLGVAALLVMALVGGGTWAYFTDTEQGTASMAAGTLMLNVNGVNTVQSFMALTNEFPADNNTSNITLKNIGSLAGKLSVAMSGITNVEGTDPRFQAGGTGDLGGNATMAIYLDLTNSGPYSTGDIGLKADGTTYNYPTALQYSTWNSYANKTWKDALNPMVSGNVTGVRIAWLIPSTCTNIIQGDSANFTITFTLNQTQAP